MELTGTLTFWDGSERPFTAQITPRVEDGCRVYVAYLPIFLDANGSPKLLRSIEMDVLPAHSTVQLLLLRAT